MDLTIHKKEALSDENYLHITADHNESVVQIG